MAYLLMVIGVLGGMVMFLFGKKQSAEALLQNNDVKSKLNEEDKNKATNDGKLEAEESKRFDLDQDAESRKNADVKPGDFN